MHTISTSSILYSENGLVTISFIIVICQESQKKKKYTLPMSSGSVSSTSSVHATVTVFLYSFRFPLISQFLACAANWWFSMKQSYFCYDDRDDPDERLGAREQHWPCVTSQTSESFLSCFVKLMFVACHKNAYSGVNFMASHNSVQHPFHRRC